MRSAGIRFPVVFFAFITSHQAVVESRLYPGLVVLLVSHWLDAQYSCVAFAWPIMGKYGTSSIKPEVHKYRNAAGGDRGTATGNMHRKFGEVSMYSSWYMLEEERRGRGVCLFASLSARTLQNFYRMVFVAEAKCLGPPLAALRTLPTSGFVVKWSARNGPGKAESVYSATHQRAATDRGRNRMFTIALLTLSRAGKSTRTEWTVLPVFVSLSRR